MRAWKDPGVRRLVATVLVAVTLLVPLAVLLLTRNNNTQTVPSEVLVHPSASLANNLVGEEQFSQLPDSNHSSKLDSPSPPVLDPSDYAPRDDPRGSHRANRSEAKRQREFQPASLPHYAFVKFSAYRQSPRTILVLGIMSYVARAFDRDRIVHTCQWHSKARIVAETVPEHIYWKTDENHGTYNPTTINCTFGEDVGAGGAGGVLVLRVSTGYDRWDRNLPVVVFEELPGELVDHTVRVNNPPKFKYAFCGAPMHGTVRADWVLQWMTYHHFLADEKAHFFFYNLGGLAEADRGMFQRFLDAGKLSITDVVDPDLVADYPTWYHHQVLFINDCLHRSRFMAERVFFIDYDEFVQVPAPDTLGGLMGRHEKEPWMSLGSVYANTYDCRRGDSGEAAVERMLWRRPSPQCRQKAKAAIDPWLCIGPLGRRKFVVDPLKTFAAGVHGVTVPVEGLNLKGDEARILHYRSAPTFKTRLCANNVKDEKAVLDAGWIRDESISHIYAHAKLFPI